MGIKKLAYFSFFVLLTFAFALIVVQNFTEPLAMREGGDTDFWEYMAYYFERNIIFFPFPHVEYVNDTHLYPFGANHVFQGWSVESNLWYTFFYRVFGPYGAWLNYYYVLCFFISTYGCFLLLKFDFGDKKALFASLIVSVFNFYAIHRYPGHFVHAVHHWLSLNILLDFILVYRIYYAKKIEAYLVLLKILLLVLCIGHEIGYVSGYALSSFTLAFFYGISLYGYRIFKKKQSLKVAIHSIFKSFIQSFKENAFANTLLIVLIAFFSWLYVSLVLQIFLEVMKFPTGESKGVTWVNPLRLLTPYFEVPLVDKYHFIMRDIPEGMGQAMIGWFVLSMSIIGMIKAPKGFWKVIFPFLILLLMCLLYHPNRFPTLKIFPWFAYNRGSGRATLFYSTIFALIAMNAVEIPKRLIVKVLYLVIALIGVYELYVNYHFKWTQKPYSFAFDFREYMEFVKKQKGEAVLDYPFCIIGGDGTGNNENLCPLYATTANVSTMQRFHEKKTIGHYYGRLFPEYIEPQMNAGFNTLMKTPSKDGHKIQKLNTCLTPEKFLFLTKFFQYNDFVGINLYTDLLPNKACELEFYRIFGNSVKSTTIPGAGKVVFIPKSEDWKKMVNLTKGKTVKYPCGCN